ncbi:tRNA-intron endonuclease [Halorubrum aquaticum]|uniref:tRNA-splicing endonuclease n=1 Tax=Halorubrum aquaticum TaxID=387340 RepID=A0A1I3BGD0_9EURY|nr:tRNA-intron lyase [Halorubrum aquaticum]SFH61200.1 tRNA-intron endonuclease [Halorubrum aquaticum]
MQPTGDLRGDAVHVGGDAKQRFYDSRGYGRPVGGNAIELSRVEAAHLLFRGDLAGVTLASDDDPAGFERFFVDSAVAVDRFAVRYLVYADLRDRGFYLSPAREPWPGGRAEVADAVDIVAYERGSTPDTGNVHYPVRVVGERESVPAGDVAGQTLAVVDEESDITYFETGRPDLEGSTDYDPPADLTGVLLADRVVVWDAPPTLYERGFYGQPLTGRAAAVEGVVQLSLVEAASLAADGVLRLSEVVDDDPASHGDGDPPGDDPVSADAAADPVSAAAAIVARGHAVEGDRFDRRLATYRDLRDRRTVPKTGFKFGADFRTYLDVETVEDLPHSEHLVRVVEPGHAFAPRELSLDVRLAGGVRKELLFALTDGSGDRGEPGADDGIDDGIEWLSVGRLTP